MSAKKKIRDSIRLITKNSDDYDEKYIKIKTIISIITIVVRVVRVHENNKYLQVFLDKL